MKIQMMIPAPRVSTLLAVAVMLFAGCESKGPAQRTGESIDRGIQSAKDTIDPPGPVEKAGRVVDRAVNP